MGEAKDFYIRPSQIPLHNVIRRQRCGKQPEVDNVVKLYRRNATAKKRELVYGRQADT
jgi:hypothetical protein